MVALWGPCPPVGSAEEGEERPAGCGKGARKIPTPASCTAVSQHATSPSFTPCSPVCQRCSRAAAWASRGR